MREYLTVWHNEVRDLIAEAMRNVLHDVQIEPRLLAFEDQDLSRKTANRSTEARVDIRTRGFWTRQQDAFFHIRVYTPKGGPAVNIRSE